MVLLVTPERKAERVVSILKASLLIGFLWGSCVAAASTVSSEAEASLEAIKQSLVELAMKSNVQLGSSAYLDTKGVLHESSILSSDADIRGIRILSYVEEAGIKAADVSADIFSLPQCPGTRPNMKRQALIRVTESKPQGQSSTRIGDHDIA